MTYQTASTHKTFVTLPKFDPLAWLIEANRKYRDNCRLERLPEYYLNDVGLRRSVTGVITRF